MSPYHPDSLTDPSQKKTSASSTTEAPVLSRKRDVHPGPIGWATIRQEWNKGTTVRKMALMFDVSLSAIYHHANQHGWPHRSKLGISGLRWGNNSGWEKPTTNHATHSPSLVDIAWVAGFLEGEGNFTSRRKKNTITTDVCAFQVNRPPLDKLLAILGGNLRSCPSRRVRQSAGFWWYCSGSRARGIAIDSGQSELDTFGAIRLFPRYDAGNSQLGPDAGASRD